MLLLAGHVIVGIDARHATQSLIPMAHSKSTG